MLESILAETATLNVRLQDASGSWHRQPIKIAIRSRGRPKWQAHPSADVVAMYVALPKEMAEHLALVPMTWLADDKLLSELEVHPGDEVNCLGFPLHAESNDAGFPVLRSGKIASYPLLPTKTVPSFLMDFPVFPGNSGGPVYLVSGNRVFAGSTHIGVFQAILGIVIQERYATERIVERSGTTERKNFLNLAEVVQAPLIRETIESLPEP